MTTSNLFGTMHVEEEVRKRVLVRICQASRIAAVMLYESPAAGREDDAGAVDLFGCFTR